MIRSRIPESRLLEQFPFFDPFRQVELQQLDGSAPCRRGRNQRTVLRQREMLGPALLSRIEQGGDLPCQGINRSQVAPFVLVAQDTGQRAIGCISRSAMLFRDHMVNLMGMETELFRHPAIFAASSRSLINPTAQRSGDMGAAHGLASRCAARIFALRIKCSRYSRLLHCASSSEFNPVSRLFSSKRSVSSCKAEDGRSANIS